MKRLLSTKKEIDEINRFQRSKTMISPSLLLRLKVKEYCHVKGMRNPFNKITLKIP